MSSIFLGWQGEGTGDTKQLGWMLKFYHNFEKSQSDISEQQIKDSSRCQASMAKAWGKCLLK